MCQQHRERAQRGRQRGEGGPRRPPAQGPLFPGARQAALHPRHECHDGPDRRERKLEARLEQLSRAPEHEQQGGGAQRVERVRGPLRERRPHQEGGHDGGARGRGGRPGEQHVEAEHAERQRRAGPLGGAPAQAHSQERGPHPLKKEPAHQQHVQPGDRQEVHQPRAGEFFLGCLGQQAAVAQQERPQHAARLAS
jgi:hypothetical protein